MSKFAALGLEVDKPGRMIVVHPVTRQPLVHKPTGAQAYVDLYSGDSLQAKRHQRAIVKRRLARGRAKLTVEEIEEEGVELLCALSAGWYLLDLEGNELNIEFSAENARELYALQEVLWLRDQVDEYIGDRANFLKASPNS